MDEQHAATATGSRAPLPAVDRVLATDVGQVAAERFGRTATVASIRASLIQVRPSWRAGASVDVSPERIAAVATLRLEEADRPSQRRIINLTGTVLHTNLGRALLAERAVEAVIAAMRSPTSLEYRLSDGRRGERDDHVRGLLRELTGAEDAVVVNNNAAAVLLTLNLLRGLDDERALEAAVADLGRATAAAAEIAT